MQPASTANPNIPLSASHLSRQARAYCQANFPAFERDIREQVFDIIRARPWILLLVLAVAAAANVPFAGPVSFGYLAPSMLLCLSAAILSRVPQQRARMTQYAPLLFDGVVFLGVIGLSLLWMAILDQGTRPKDNPVQFTLAAVCMLSYHPRYRNILIRNILYAFAMGTIFLVYAPSFFAESVGHFIGGIGIGSWLALIGFNGQQMRFYSTSILRNLNVHLHEELASLVYEHQRRLLETYHPLEETMELQPKMAYLGEFDIIDSSSLVSHDQYEQIKNEIFSACYKRILKNYTINPDALHRPASDGHLVKEMGDGFIFSVGFPFDLPASSGSGADVSLQMAVDFLNIFEENIGALRTDTQCKSVVVLTKSMVRAFWTHYQVKRYDFEQKCMTRVARLGEFRRVFLSKNREASGSFILMDEDFAQDLSPHWKGSLEKISLADYNWQIRNHPEIVTVYVYKLPQALFKAA